MSALIVLKYMMYGIGLLCAVSIVAVTQSKRLYGRLGRKLVSTLYYVALGAVIFAGILWLIARTLEG